MNKTNTFPETNNDKNIKTWFDVLFVEFNQLDVDYFEIEIAFP